MSEKKINKITFWVPILGTIIGLVGGVIIGVVLTFWVIRSQQNYETDKNDRELGIKFCEIINTRYYLAQNVNFAAVSPQFDERWEMYMEHGVVTWNIHNRIIHKFIKKKHADILQALEKMDRCFLKTHDDLRNIKNTRENSTFKKLQNDIDLLATKREESLTEKKKDIQNEINNKIKERDALIKPTSEKVKTELDRMKSFIDKINEKLYDF